MTTRNPLTKLIALFVVILFAAHLIGYCFAGWTGVAMVFGFLSLVAMTSIILAAGLMAHGNGEEL